MNTLPCPRCHGTGEERVDGSAVECVPDEIRPCLLCLGFGDIPEGMARAYRQGGWQIGACDECGQEHVIVDDGVLLLCANCWALTEVEVLTVIEDALTKAKEATG